MLLSICIPNYNRGKYLNNCLNSILLAKSFSSIKFEVCISDNGSTDNISSIVNYYKKKKLLINYKRSHKNLGFGANFHKVVKMAKGEFIWIIGNDDLLYLDSLNKLEKLFLKHKDIDFYFVNSSSLNSKFVFNKKQPFNTKKIPKRLTSFSKIKKSRKTKFFDLIDPSVSWEFLLAIFLTVYRRKKFIKSFNILNKKNCMTVEFGLQLITRHRTSRCFLMLLKILIVIFKQNHFQLICLVRKSGTIFIHL